MSKVKTTHTTSDNLQQLNLIWDNGGNLMLREIWFGVLVSKYCCFTPY